MSGWDPSMTFTFEKVTEIWAAFGKLGGAAMAATPQEARRIDVTAIRDILDI